MARTLVGIGAHSADFVWRAAGTIALVTSQGDSAIVIALSYGERGESGVLWKEPNQTEENVKKIRHEQASKAAGIVGASFRCLDLGDYPLVITDAALEQLVVLLRELQPDILLTHTPKDPFNPDHPVASQAAQKARCWLLGQAWPVPSSASNLPVSTSLSHTNQSCVSSSPTPLWTSHP